MAFDLHLKALGSEFNSSGCDQDIPALSCTSTAAPKHVVPSVVCADFSS